MILPKHLRAHLLTGLLSAGLLLPAGCADTPPGTGGSGDNNGGTVNNGGGDNSGGGENNPDNNGGANNGENNPNNGGGNSPNSSTNNPNNGGDNNGGGNNGENNPNNSTNNPGNNGGNNVDICTPEPTESCDGLDNNCNGSVDEGCTCSVAEQACYAGPPSTINVGLCRQGTQRCTGEFYGECTGQVLPEVERCDGIDNDCDGEVDEGFGVGQRCGGGEGECTSQGTLRCNAAGDDVECNAVEVEPGPERCDGLDNDCDGQIDEDFAELGEACTVGLGLCENTGQIICDASGEATRCSAAPRAPQEERCDGLDNNCNGSVDEAFPGLNGACTSGQGVCARQGTLRCAEDGRSAACDATPGQPAAEVCDGQDNNCDGLVDELSECSNQPPAIQCQGSVTAATLDTVTLTANVSDPDGDAVTVAWQIVSAPGGSTSSLSRATGTSTNLFLDLAGTWVVRYTATDSNGATASCEVTVVSQPSEQFRVEMIWNVGVSGDTSDVDLHLRHMGQSDNWFTSSDCYYANCNSSRGQVLSWGGSSTADNPRLDLDDVEGNGPENINIDDPENATYQVGVHYYDNDAEGDATVIIRIYCNGSLAREFEPVILSASGANSSGNDFWRVANVIWNGPICQVQELGSPGNRDITTRGSL